MDLPRWIRKHVNEDQLKSIEEAVAQVESKTSAEIVPMIVSRSTAIGHTWLSLFLLYWFLFFIFGVHYWEVYYFDLGPVTWLFYLGFCLVFILIGRRCSWIMRWLTPTWDQQKQVMQRAQLEFYQSNIKRTANATGILFFISLFERRAVVLADQAIADKLPPKTWQEIVGTMVKGTKHEHLAAGMREAILQSEKLLVPLFPIQPDDQNEIPNTVIIKE